MAWTTPTTQTSGVLITAAIWNTDIVDNLKYLIASPVFTGNPTVGDGTNTRTFIVKGTNTGAGGGAQVAVYVGASAALNLGNESNILGTAYSDVGYVYGATGLKFGTGGSTRLTIESAGDVSVATNLKVAPTGRLYLDGGGDTYLVESSANNVSLQVGGAERMAVSSTAITPTLPITNAAQYRCGAYNNAGQSIASATWTSANLNSEDYDVGTMHDTATNNSRITVPTGGGGLYYVCGILSFDSNGTGVRAGRLRKNGATVLTQCNQPNAGATDAVSVPLNTVISLNAADYIEMQGYQNSGGNLNIGSATRELGCTLQMVKLW